MFRLAESLSAVLLIAGSASAQREDGQFWPCNPIKNATGACKPNPGLPTTKYEIDFTKVTSIPPEWTISNYATINFGPNGAEFTYNKRWDAPQLWTNFFILFGKVDVEMRIASGVGMISSAVLMSDDFDEIGEFNSFHFSCNDTLYERLLTAAPFPQTSNSPATTSATQPGPPVLVKTTTSAKVSQETTIEVHISKFLVLRILFIHILSNGAKRF